MQVAVSGVSGTEKARGQAKALQWMLGGTVFKGKAYSNGTLTDLKKRARCET